MDEWLISTKDEEKTYWRSMWQYRDLLYFLAWRDILVRYKETSVGVAWALFRPVMQIVLFTFVFEKVAKLPSGVVPYSLLVTAGSLPWQLFATSFSEVGNSLSSSSQLISKIYFPRLLIPASKLAVSIMDFSFSFVILIFMLAWNRYVPDVRCLTLPLFFLLDAVASLGVGLWLAALNVEFRDFRFVAPFLLQIAFFASPVGYLSSNVPPGARFLYSLNPMVGVIDGFRWAIFRGQYPLYWPSLILSACMSVMLLVTAILYFRRREKAFAEA